MFRIHFILMWIRIRGFTFGNIGSESDVKSKKFQFIFPNFFLYFCHVSLLFMFIKQKNLKRISLKKYFLIILVDLYATLSRFLVAQIRIHVSRSGSGSGQMIRIRPDLKHWKKSYTPFYHVSIWYHSEIRVSRIGTV